MCGDGFFNFHPFHPLIIISHLIDFFSTFFQVKPMRCSGNGDEGEEENEYTNSKFNCQNGTDSRLMNSSILCT